ncbi:MAG: hypothetical protein KatS3mg001_379 [Candidatus Pacearchaeota archaeon]|nr:MAG: hypothetical protein KatS3mg001_379 [Candidatus Pacearchaeota archaeon]
MKIKNKKGDVPVTILVLGVIIIFISAIISFSFSSFLFKKDFNLESIEQAKIMKEKFLVYQELGVEDVESKFAPPLKEDAQGKFIEIEEEKIKVKIYILD